MLKNRKNIQVFAYLCCRKEGLTARGQPLTFARRRVYNLLKALWIQAANAK